MSATAGTIVAQGLTKRFGEKLALAPLELTLGPGGITGLLGPNGSGKSTFLRLLTGLLIPDSGAASVDGVALLGDGTAIRARCTYSPGEIALYGELVARDHLAWLLRGREPEALARATSLAQELELPLEKRVRTYSHGMKRQLLFAAALAPRVRVRILDELTEGLDPHKRSRVLEHLEADARSGTTILLSSHHLGEVDRVCERLVFLHEGEKLADETAADVARRAQRLVKLSYADEHTTSIAAREFGVFATSVRSEGQRLVLQLAAEDPREFLAVLAARRTLAAPNAIEYGALSLGELYRELYGVEGC